MVNYKRCYNIASRATQSNSVYVSVLQISTVHAGHDGLRNIFSWERPLSTRGKIRDNVGYRDSATSPNFPTFSHGLELLNKAEKEKKNNNGKGNSASALSRFASL